MVMVRTLAESRLRVKRAFARYYLDVCGPSIADPSEVTAALAEYFSVRRREVGDVLFNLEFDDDTVGLAGEIEQDLRQRHKGAIRGCLAREPLDGRFQECVAIVRGRSGPTA